MADKNHGTSKSDTARAERLKRALRQNLKRRKAQQRARDRNGTVRSHESAGFAADKPKG
jgi:hypothetical protein